MSALKNAKEPAVIRSAFDLPSEERATIQNAVNETFSADIHLRFETAPGLVSGIELTANGQKVAWSIADYLTSLEKGVSELVKQQDKPEPRPAPKPDTKPEPKPEAKSEPKPDAKLAVPAAAEAKSEPMPKAEPTPKPEADAKTKPVPEAESKAAAKPKAEAKPSSKPEAKPEPKSVAKPDAEPAAKPVPAEAAPIGS